MPRERVTAVGPGTSLADRKRRAGQRLLIGLSGLAVTEDERPVLSGLAGRGSLAEWLALWDKVSHLLARVEGANLDRKQALLAAFLELEALARAR